MKHITSNVDKLKANPYEYFTDEAKCIRIIKLQNAIKMTEKDIDEYKAYARYINGVKIFYLQNSIKELKEKLDKEFSR